MAAKQKRKFELSPELNESVITSRFRVSYNHLIEPWTGDEAKPARYSLQCIFDKDDPWIKDAKKRVAKIAVEAFGANAVKLLKAGRLKNPFRDGDLEDDLDSDIYSGKIFFNAGGSTAGKRPPGLINQRKKDIRKMDNPDEHFYSGCYARAEIKFYPFDEAGGKGVAVFVFNVQKLADGDPLTGGHSAESVFDEVEEEDDDSDDMGLDDEDDDIAL
jgi:hypothetical protein